ncbi:MAG: class II fructose-bisphosphate aldolase [Myxococcota bacterium]
MPISTMDELRRALEGVVAVGPDGHVTVRSESDLRGDLCDRLVRTAVFADDAKVKDAARWLIRRIAHAVGAVPASIQPLYEAMGRKEVEGFTVPAINIRGMTYDVARAVLRAARARDCGAVVFEIARSEIGYTEQRPAEYAACCLAAAVREGWRGPVFIQGDHFQYSAKKHAADPAKETAAIADLVREAVGAGFYNIDIDSSTLVDLSFPSLREQQRLNFVRCAEMTEVVRKAEPQGVTVSVGGEIGEVGKKNSTPDELRAFMNGYLEEIHRRGIAKGISKISVQTGTSHGGIPLPDGRVADVKLDFPTLEALSRVAQGEFGLAGAVQHGASTLPEECFDQFPTRTACEIHLATGFQNLIYAHPAFPKELLARIDEHLRAASKDERKPDETDEQFIYKTRKKAFGPFKREMWDLPAAARNAITADLQARFELLMGKLGVSGTRAIVDRHVRPAIVEAGDTPAGLAG